MKQMTNLKKPRYTPQQEAAIKEDGQNILVSASAGSGKTMVLVERLMHKISKNDNVTDFLVVTFTRAAAKEMKDRVQRKIQERITQLPPGDNEKQHLIKQLPLVGQANISTIHSFCTQVIKKYYYLIDTDPIFRMMTDETEVELLKEEVLDKCIELKLEEEDPRFLNFLEMFAGSSNLDKVKKLVLKVYQFAMSKPDYIDWIKKLDQPYSENRVEDMSIYQHVIKDDITLSLEQCLSKAKNLCQIAQGAEEFSKYIDIYNNLTPLYEQMLVYIQNNQLDNLYYELKNYKHPRKPTKPKDEDLKATDQLLDSIHKEIKEIIKGLVDKYFTYPLDEQLEKLNQLQPVIQSFQELLFFFHSELTKKKEAINALDFTDLEHKTLEILTHNSGEAVRHYQATFKEIMIDEYQDTNLLQETILKLISRESQGNRFMVGDVKQSIYRFRLAEPGLFIDKYNQYGQSNDGKRIILQKNFRSRPEVLDFTNYIFQQIMDPAVGEIEYNDEAVLNVWNTNFPQVNNMQAELLIYESSTDQYQLENIDEQDRIQNAYQGESILVAQKIRELVDCQFKIYQKGDDRIDAHNRPVEYGDIVVLASSRSNYPELQEAFNEYQIPTIIDHSESYFKRTEIITMMSLLKIIDNPIQDIPLAAVLRSPIVGLNEPELAEIRLSNKKSSYYQAMVEFAESTDPSINISLQKTIQDFLNKLSEWRDYSRFNSLANLIWKLYLDTHYLEYVGGLVNGDQRQSNLHALYQRAASYEETSFKGLFQFIKFIEHMQKRDNDLAEASKVTEDDNAVRIMTIHKSKGLEFPIVFLVNAHKEFQVKGAQGKQSIDDEEGFATDYIDQAKSLYYPTWINSGIKQKLLTQMVSEELRLLYVALTRAEQKIFISGQHKSKDEAIKEWMSVANHPSLILPEKERLEPTKGFLALIGKALIRHKNMAQYRDTSDSRSLPYSDIDFEIHFASEKDLQERKEGILKNRIQSDELSREMQTKELDSKALVDQLKSLITYDYTHKQATITSSFQAVSDINRIIEEPDDERQVKINVSYDRITPQRYVTDDLNSPKFMQSSSRTVSPADVGSATHLILQKLDLSKPVTMQTIESHLQELVEAEVIESAVAKKIDLSRIKSFASSDLGQLIQENYASLRREVPFSLLVEARQFFDFIENSDDNVLIHGVIDGFIIEDSKIHLFDYKTDRVKHLKDPIGELKSRYKSQLNIYKLALQTIYPDCPVNKLTIYSLDLNQPIEL